MSATHSIDEAVAPQYAIAVSDTLQQRRTRTLKHGDTFAVIGLVLSAAGIALLFARKVAGAGAAGAH